MSHYDPHFAYNSKFRALIMHLFMDDLGIEQIEKYWFLGDLPERLKDDPNKARSETLTYVQHEGLLEEWAEKPRILRKILEEIGRTDLSIKVQKLVAQAPGDDSESKVDVLDYTVNRSETSPVVVRRRSRPDVQKKKLYRTSSSRQLEALCLEDEFRGRSSSNASARSSGYWSIRYSDARLSQVSIPESVDEEDESNEESPSNLVKQLQSTAIEEDEGVMDINRIEWSDMEPMHRPRAIQVSKTWQPNRKHNKVKCSDHSQTLPYSSSTVQGAALSCITLDPISSSHSSSSSSSLDSDDTLTSPSTERRLTILPKPKPYPVVSSVNISGSMKIKVMDILKSVKDSQCSMTSDEFPSPNGYYGPRYEMIFHPSNYSKEHASLYIHVAPSYLSSKQQSTVEIPTMDITVTLSYDGDSVGGSGESSEIKSVTIHNEKKKIDCESGCQRMPPVASFPQLVSHAELKLTESKGQSLVVTVNMNV